MRHGEAIRFAYELVGIDWSRATLVEGEHQITPISSYLSNSLGVLTETVVALLQSANRMTVAWAQAPGEYRWILEKYQDRLRRRILWFDETFSLKLDEQGKLLFETDSELLRFATHCVRNDIPAQVTLNMYHSELWFFGCTFTLCSLRYVTCPGPAPLILRTSLSWQYTTSTPPELRAALLYAAVSAAMRRVSSEGAAPPVRATTCPPGISRAWNHQS